MQQMSGSEHAGYLASHTLGRHLAAGLQHFEDLTANDGTEKTMQGFLNDKRKEIAHFLGLYAIDCSHVKNTNTPDQVVAKWRHVIEEVLTMEEDAEAIREIRRREKAYSSMGTATASKSNGFNHESRIKRVVDQDQRGGGPINYLIALEPDTPEEREASKPQVSKIAELIDAICKEVPDDLLEAHLQKHVVHGRSGTLQQRVQRFLTQGMTLKNGTLPEEVYTRADVLFGLSEQPKTKKGGKRELAHS